MNATLAPTNPAEVAEFVTSAAERGAIVAIGGHAEPDALREREPLRERVRLDLRALDRVLEFAPEDQTVTVECGVMLGSLAVVLAEKGQQLMLDASDPQTTVGGGIAANAFGPRRHAYGTFKDLVLGVSLVRVDGTAARAGGKVVKNVAGFDLAKLVVGSFGTLAILTSATLRVHPRAEAARAFRLGGLTAEAVWAWVGTSRERRLDPAAVLSARQATGDGYELDVLVEGFAAGVAAKATLLADLSRDAGATLDEFDANALRDVDRRARSGAPLRLRVAAPSSELHRIQHDHLAPLGAGLGDLADVAYPTLGLAFLGGTVRDTEAAVKALLATRAAVERCGGSLVLEAAPHEIESRVDAIGALPPSLPLMRAVKDRFDPEHRLNRGAFPGGLL